MSRLMNFFLETQFPVSAPPEAIEAGLGELRAEVEKGGYQWSEPAPRFEERNGKQVRVYRVELGNGWV